MWPRASSRTLLSSRPLQPPEQPQRLFPEPSARGPARLLERPQLPELYLRPRRRARRRLLPAGSAASDRPRLRRASARAPRAGGGRAGRLPAARSAPPMRRAPPAAGPRLGGWVGASFGQDRGPDGGRERRGSAPAVGGSRGGRFHTFRRGGRPPLAGRPGSSCNVTGRPAALYGPPGPGSAPLGLETAWPGTSAALRVLPSPVQGAVPLWPASATLGESPVLCVTSGPKM